MEKSENESIEDALLKEAHFAFQRMTATKSSRGAPVLEKWFRPRLRLALLDIQIREAKRCDAYKTLGSPRVIELEAERDKAAFEVAKLDQERRGMK